MKFIKTFIFTLILIVAGIAAYIYSGNYDVAATSPDSIVVKWTLDFAKHRSIKKHSYGIERPRLNDGELVEIGFHHYENMCIGCHGSPNAEPAKGFNPSPPRLAKEAEELSSSELFWITKNGIKMTGMPAFGIDHSDEDIWAIVAFLKRLSDLSPEEYQLMKNSNMLSGMEGKSDVDDFEHDEHYGH